MSELKKYRILLTDELHFHERNFKSLFSFFEKYNPIVTNAKAPKEWLSLYGNYFAKSNDLRSRVIDLEFIDKDELFSFQYRGINVFEVCKLEFLSHVMAKKFWRNQDINNNSGVIFELAYQHENEALLYNMAAVIFWIDWWEKKLREIPNQDYCCIFSGSLIYSRVLIEILKKNTAEPILLESLFTGNDYYFEKKYEHLPNNSNLVFPTYYDSINLSEDHNEYDLDRIKAANKILLSKNKNVEQPVSSPDFGFTNKKPVVLLIGQVVNDFSVLGTDGPLSTITQYKKIIEGILLGTSYNVVFKAHPWESKKIGVNAPVTKKELESTLEEKYKDRFIIVEDYNLEIAFGQSDLVVTLCSQAAIEAAFNGFKTVQLGNAFYGGKGFTHDYITVEEFLEDLRNDRVQGKLNLLEFDLFERFCVKSLLGHFVSVHPSGHKIIMKTLLKNRSVKLVTKNLGLHKDDVPNKTQKSDLKSESKFEVVIGQKNVEDVHLIKNQCTIEEISKYDRKSKLMKKLRNNPYAYFRDSKYLPLRLISFFLKKK